MVAPDGAIVTFGAAGRAGTVTGYLAGSASGLTLEGIDTSLGYVGLVQSGANILGEGSLIGQLAHSAGSALLFTGIALDYGEWHNGSLSTGNFLLNTAVAIVPPALIGPPGAILSGSYFLSGQIPEPSRPPMIDLPSLVEPHM